jgi:hypothetical protein
MASDRKKLQQRIERSVRSLTWRAPKALIDNGSFSVSVSLDGMTLGGPMYRAWDRSESVRDHSQRVIVAAALRILERQRAAVR